MEFLKDLAIPDNANYLRSLRHALLILQQKLARPVQTNTKVPSSFRQEPSLTTM